jgi:membrane fusion protein (multidrug efflux system)
MYVRAIVTEGVVPRAVLVPQHAIAREPDGGGRALVVGKDGKVEARSVELSRAVGDRWLVERGLQPSERLVVDGLHKASPGLVVRAVEHSATERVAGHVGPVQ